MLTFAIGDIHGCRTLLVDLLAQIERHAAGESHRIVCLGDYIDRGPDSAGTVELLREREARAATGTFVCLKGNHEDMLATARRRAGSVELWLRNGGDETVRSYGVAGVDGLPGHAVDWLESRPTAFEDGRRCFVHAGLHPARSRADQSDEDRLWIRNAFLEENHDFGRYVVHGHTPILTGVPDVRQHRVNLDTAAVYGGRLTAGIFSDDQDGPAGFLQAG